MAKCNENRDNSEKAEFILRSILIENKHNNSKISSDLYIPQLISLKSNSLSQSQSQLINYLHNLHNPEKFVDTPFSQILLNPKDNVWDEQFISQHNAWNFIGFLKYLGMQSPDINWESKLNFKKMMKKNNEKFSLNVSHNDFSK